MVNDGGAMWKSESFSDDCLNSRFLAGSDCVVDCQILRRKNGYLDRYRENLHRSLFDVVHHEAVRQNAD